VLIYIPCPPCSHAAENRSSACRRPCSEDATNTKSFAESKRLILHFPAMTPTSTRLFIHVIYSTFSKRSVHSTHSCRNPTPTVKGCVLPSLTRAQTYVQECSELFQIIFWAAGWSLEFNSCRGDWCERSCPRGATAFHSVAWSLSTNLPYLERKFWNTAEL